MRVVDFSDGYESSTAPDASAISASAIKSFADTTAFLAFKGSAAADGDIFYNTTSDQYAAFMNGAWKELASSQGAQTLAGNKTFSNDVIVTGDLTVNGTTTTMNVATFDVEDPNITLNKNGNQATANASKAGLTIEMSDATHAKIGYDSSLASKFKAGESGSEIEIVTVSHTQVLTNKDIDGGTASNTSRLTAPKGATATIAALTRKAATLVYDTTLAKLFVDNGSALKKLLDEDLPSAQILVGNSSNVATETAISGDISLSNTGVTAYSGTVPLNKGGTGQTTKAPAFDALSPMTTGGDLIYGGASGTGTRLPNGNAGEFLKSQGTTLAPIWAAISALGSVALKTYTTSGTYTPTSGMKFCVAFVTAAGGNGGAGGSGGTQSSGGGGGAGETRIGVFDAATIGASQTVTIGGVGSNSSLGSLLTAVKGNNGGAGSGSTPGNGGGYGTGGSGGFGIPGGAGSYGISSGGVVNSAGVNGGGSFWGGGGRGGAQGGTGDDGAAYGAGGGSGGGASGSAGGAGAGGVVFILEFI